MKTTGRYYKSLQEWRNAGGNGQYKDKPSISVTGSVRGMRKLYWGYKCDVVRVGAWIYKVN